MSRLPKVISILLGVAAISASLATTSAYAKRPLGGIDTGQACVYQHGIGTYAAISGSSRGRGAAYHWICKLNWFKVGGIDMNRACRDQYRVGNAWAEARDPNSAYSWFCFRP